MNTSEETRRGAGTRLGLALAVLALSAATCQGAAGNAYGNAETVQLAPGETIERTIVVSVPSDVVGQLRSAELELSVTPAADPFPRVVFSLGEEINESVAVDELGAVNRKYDVTKWLGSCAPDDCTIGVPLTISNEGGAEAAFMWSSDVGVLTEDEAPGLDVITICVAELDEGCES